jgi:hypothetical protein
VFFALVQNPPANNLSRLLTLAPAHLHIFSVSAYISHRDPIVEKRRISRVVNRAPSQLASALRAVRAGPAHPAVRRRLCSIRERFSRLLACDCALGTVAGLARNDNKGVVVRRQCGACLFIMDKKSRRAARGDGALGAAVGCAAGRHKCGGVVPASRSGRDGPGRGQRGRRRYSARGRGCAVLGIRCCLRYPCISSGVVVVVVVALAVAVVVGISMVSVMRWRRLS